MQEIEALMQAPPMLTLFWSTDILDKIHVPPHLFAKSPPLPQLS